MRPEVVVGRGRAAAWQPALLSVAIWTTFGLLCATSAYWGVRTHGHSAAKIALYFALVWNAWAVATPFVGRLARRFPLVPFSWTSSVTHVAIAVTAGLVHVAWWSVLYVVMRPYDDMGTRDVAVAFGGDLADRMFVEGTVYFAIAFVWNAVDYRRGMRERELRAVQLESSLAHAKLDALELQLQPHFLFNTLHAIGGLVRQSRGPEAIEMIAGLSDLLRYSLDHAGKHLVPLGQELAITERYLAIQKLRFSDRLVVELDVPEALRGCAVPAMLLQPLVENAVRHGIEPAAGPGTIAIRVRRVAAMVEVEVRNPGALGDWRAGIGIANTRARLAQLYGDRWALELGDDAGEVRVTIRVPEEPA